LFKLQCNLGYIYPVVEVEVSVDSLLWIRFYSMATEVSTTEVPTTEVSTRPVVEVAEVSVLRLDSLSIKISGG
jgi:hypothetical protein